LPKSVVYPRVNLTGCGLDSLSLLDSRQGSVVPSQLQPLVGRSPGRLGGRRRSDDRRARGSRAGARRASVAQAAEPHPTSTKRIGCSGAHTTDDNWQWFLHFSSRAKNALACPIALLTQPFDGPQAERCPLRTGGFAISSSVLAQDRPLSWRRKQPGTHRLHPAFRAIKSLLIHLSGFPI
jgi:hypothetical protein